MADILNIINWLYNELIPLSPMKQEYQQKLDKKFRLEFNYNSNHLEGNTLTYGETELLLIFGQTKGSHDKQEYDEMEAHDVAYKKIIEWATDRERPLTEMDIKNLNEVILVRPFWKEAITPDGQPTRRQIKIGSYKEFPNSVQLQNGEIFYYTSPSETPIQMGELIEWYRNEEEKKELHPVTLAAMLHYRFVRIHPFDDGNGRISRLLVNYVLLRNYFPPIIIKSADKKNYLNALHQADAGFLEEFVNYIAEQVKWSFEISIKAAKGEDIDEPGDLDKKLAQLKRKLGQQSNKKVEVRYNEDTVISIAEKVIMPIADAWEDILKGFDTFFFSRSVLISAPGTGKKGDSMSTAFKEFFSNQLLNSLGLIEPISEIKLIAGFQKLRLAGDSTSYNGGEVKFIFHQNAYEVEYTGSNKSISKLYDETLTEDEIKIIVETVGSWFFANIEKAIENESRNQP